MPPAPFDVIIRGGRWFDGTGAPAAVRNLGIRDGRVAEISSDELDATGCPSVVDADGQWVLPGMVDIHTHYDVEVLREPELVESLRHGVTTILLGSCSLSTLHVDPTTAGDLFGATSSRRSSWRRATAAAGATPRSTSTTSSRCPSAPTSRRSSATPTSAPR
jgi:N-acyl-D-aspartate/D-glutamate deacylase